MGTVLLVSLAFGLAVVGCKNVVVRRGDASTGSAAVMSDAGEDDPTIDWPDAPRAVAKDLTHEYGTPEDVTSTMLIWGARGPFKRIVVFRDPVSHDFPKPHVDVVEEVVDAKVPVAKVAELAAFDGSLLVDRTKGELASRCADEGTNMLALNLAMQILAGTKTAEQARQELANVVASGDLPTTLDFEPAQGDQGDPDVPVP